MSLDILQTLREEMKRQDASLKERLLKLLEGAPTPEPVEVLTDSHNLYIDRRKREVIIEPDSEDEAERVTISFEEFAAVVKGT